MLELIKHGHNAVRFSGFKLLLVWLSSEFILELILGVHSRVALFHRKAAKILSMCLASSEPLAIIEIFHPLTALFLDLSWQESIPCVNQLPGFLVHLGKDTVSFHHLAL